MIMGLDMYLYGEKSVSSETDGNPIMEDGFIVENKTLNMGYWRKHANLHGFIVKEFADDNDDCSRIWLGEEDLEKIIETLPTDGMFDERVDGFFFGRSFFPGEKDAYGSYEEQKSRDISIFTKALEWCRNKAPGVGKYGDDNFKWPESRGVYYQASW